MHIVTSAVLAASMFLSLALPVQADPLPATAGPPDPQRIARIYAGKTELWNGKCSGGIYYSRTMQARAWCAGSSKAFGAGEWTIDTEGRICYTLTWYWPDDRGPGAGDPDRTCVEHRADGRGGIWRRWPGDEEWWPMKNTDRPLRGYRYKRNIETARAATWF